MDFGTCLFNDELCLDFDLSGEQDSENSFQQTTNESCNWTNKLFNLKPLIKVFDLYLSFLVVADGTKIKHVINKFLQG